MNVQITTISEEDKRAIDEAAERLYYVEKDETGTKTITMYADYRDTNEGLLDDVYENRKIAYDSKSDYEPDYALMCIMQDKIASWYQETEFYVEDRILTGANVDLFDDLAGERRQYIRDNYCITPDFDHFLDQSMKVNIMIAFDSEANRDFVSIHEQYEALNDLYPELVKDALEEETGLSWLVRQQGHTMDELKTTLDEYHKFFDSDEAYDLESYEKRYEKFCENHNVFLTSVCQELDNMVNYMNTITVLLNMTMKEFAEMMQPGKECVLSTGTMVGIFNPWNGGGSVLGIELEKDLILPSELIWDIQIEGAKMEHQYSVANVYDFIGSVWKEVKAVRETESVTKGSSLDSIIASASQRSTDSITNNFEAPAITENNPEREQMYTCDFEEGRNED